MLSCIKLVALVWRVRPVVLFSSSLQEVFLFYPLSSCYQGKIFFTLNVFIQKHIC